jgi:hypothetical protein
VRRDLALRELADGLADGLVVVGQFEINHCFSSFRI